MALVTAPLLSLDASGKVGDALVFSKWKGRNYVRALVRPSNPKSGGQVGMRSMFKFLSQEWAGIGASPKATWEALAEAAAVAPFNSFMSKNLFANRNFLAPSEGYPLDPTGTVDAIATFTATAGERQISIVLNSVTPSTEAWGWLLYRSLSSGFTPAFDNLIAVIAANAVANVTFVDTPLEADTYYYDAKPFSATGFIGSLDGEINAVVT